MTDDRHLGYLTDEGRQERAIAEIAARRHDEWLIAVVLIVLIVATAAVLIVAMLSGWHPW